MVEFKEQKSEERILKKCYTEMGDSKELIKTGQVFFLKFLGPPKVFQIVEW